MGPKTNFDVGFIGAISLLTVRFSRRWTVVSSTPLTICNLLAPASDTQTRNSFAPKIGLRKLSHQIVALFLAYSLNRWLSLFSVGMQAEFNRYCSEGIRTIISCQIWKYWTESLCNVVLLPLGWGMYTLYMCICVCVVCVLVCVCMWWCWCLFVCVLMFFCVCVSCVSCVCVCLCVCVCVCVYWYVCAYICVCV